jgi:hypothetical protein
MHNYVTKLEQRCKNFKKLIDKKYTTENLVIEHDEGNITFNDFRYLLGLVEIEHEPIMTFLPCDGTSIAYGKKPPLGVKPRYIHDCERHVELAEAIERYLEVGKEIPTEWIEEYNEISRRYQVEEENND